MLTNSWDHKRDQFFHVKYSRTVTKNRCELSPCPDWRTNYSRWAPRAGSVPCTGDMTPLGSASHSPWSGTHTPGEWTALAQMGDLWNTMFCMCTLLFAMWKEALNGWMQTALAQMKALRNSVLYVYIIVLCHVKKGPQTMDVCRWPWHKWRVSEILCCVRVHYCFMRCEKKPSNSGCVWTALMQMEAPCIVDTYVYITASCTVRRGPHRMDVCGQPWHK